MPWVRTGTWFPSPSCVRPRPASRKLERLVGKQTMELPHAGLMVPPDPGLHCDDPLALIELPHHGHGEQMSRLSPQTLTSQEQTSFLRAAQAHPRDELMFSLAL